MFENDYEYRENKIKEKLKWMIAIILGIVFIIVVTKLLDSCSRRFAEDIIKEKDTEEIQEKLSMHKEYEAGEVLVGIAKRNGDWSSYPLSKEFLKKYNSKDGIFMQYNFEEISWRTMKSDYYSDQNGTFYYYLYTNIDREKHIIGPAWNITIEYTLNEKDELDDVEIISARQELDEYGDPVRDYDKEFTEKNIHLLNDLLFFDHWCWYYSMFPDRPVIRKEPISKKIVERIWKDKEDESKGYIDFFDGLEYTVGNVYWLKYKTKKEAFNENDLYCICKLYKKGEEPYYDNEIDYDPIKNYLYKVDISLDKEKKLDDIKVRFIREITNEEMKEKYTARLVEEVNE